MSLRRAIGMLSGLGCLLLAAALVSVAVADEARAVPVRTDALVLVNSQSDAYPDFVQFIQPYLDNFGVPYALLDVATTPLPANAGDFSLLIVGHRRLDVGGAYLDAAEQTTLATAVSDGTGLVNFDNDLWTGAGAARYAFLDAIFGFGRGGAATGSGVTFSDPHYITARHVTDTSISTGVMRLAGITLPATATAVAVSDQQPFLAATGYGAGRAVQWGSYDWMSHAVFGPVHGLDDLVWRSLAWAAHKPFVMQVLPPIVTMRVDDEKGPFDWVHTANDFGFRPWVGLFFDEVSNADAADLSALTNAGQATASVHAFSDVSANGADGTFFYYDAANRQNFPNAVVASNFAAGTQWHQQHNVPISKFVVPHYYEFGSNVFAGLSDWGVEFVGTTLRPGDAYDAADWAANGPYRRYESGPADSVVPLYYADFLHVPGHPELDGRFFNSVTEIRDENGYEWHPTDDVSATIGHGTAQVVRALDSRVLGTLFTHSYYIQAIPSSNWRAILQGINANLAGYGPISMTMDDASRYVRALSTSAITSGTYDAGAQTVRTVLTGSTDVTTSFSLFTGNGGQINESRVSVPPFSGSTVLVDSLGGSSDVTPPQISAVSAGQPSAAAATITWATDEPASSQVEYGTTTAYGSATTLDTTLANSHSQLVSGLVGNTTYHFRVLSRDAAGNLATSADSTFATAVPALAINDVTVTEGNSGATNAVFTVSLSAPSGLPASVNYATVAGTATAGSDYTAASGSLSFPAGATTRTISVPVLGDTAAEADETFTVALSGASGATLADASGLGTIVDDDTVATSVTINSWDDAHQSPVLATTTNAGAINLTDGQWTEFLYTAGRSFPTVVAGTNEYENNALPPMRFFTSGLANGTYDVYANLYTQDAGRNMRYYWGYSATDTRHYSIDTVGGSGGSTQHTEYLLGSVTITDGSFSLYAQDADLLSGSYAVFGWAWIRLVPTGSDVTPPQISAVSAGQPSAAAATITWATDEPASSQVEYGTTTAYGSATTLDTTLANSHSQLVSGLVGNTTYHFRVLSRDAAGNLATSADSTFATAVPALAINDVTVTEGNSGATNAVFTVSLSAPSGLPASVNYATVAGTATAGSDYTAASGSLSFPAGATTRTISVPVLGDTAAEADETFTVALSGASGATLADASGLGTIGNDDAVPALAINDVTVTEGNSGATNAVFTVSLSAPSGLPASVNYATVAGTATAGSDYTAASGSLSFPAGATTRTISVPVLGDTAAEADETFTVALSGASGATLADASGLGTIGNDDAVPALAINDVTVTEGNSGATNAVFTVSLSAPSGLPASVNYATVAGTATAGSDYTAASGSLSFPAGATTRTISVPVLGDTAAEADETFTVALSGASGATLADASGLGTIGNDDAVPALAINDVTVTEGNSGATNAVFTVSLSAAYPLAVSVNYATVAGTATAGSDFTAASGTLTFATGVTSQTLSVPVQGDALYEAAETFTVALSGASGATLADASGLGTIGNDDAVPALAINDVTVTEGNSGATNAVFTVSLSAPSGLPASVNYATVAGTATAGSDYTAASGSLSFPAGATTRTISVPVLGDTAAEADETFTVALSGASGATLADASGLGTIGNDDAVPALAINDVTVTEGNSGATNAVFTVSLSAAYPLAVSVNYATVAGTATAGSDFTAASGTLTFATGVTSQTLSVPVQGDALYEAAETFTVALSGASGATLADASGLGTIGNDDAVPALAINDVTVTEGNSGATNAVFTVSLSAPSGLPASVNYATVAGTATAGSDYTAASGSLSFPAGATTRTISVPVLGDTAAEADETFTVALSGASGATLADASGLGTIVDDDTVATSVTINSWDDAHQSPVLATTTNAGAINLTDGQWTEFLYTAGRSFPTVVAGTNEYENNALPPMRFFTSGLANGTYDVYANLYTQDAGRNMRYYWGYSATDTRHYSIDTVGGSGGSTQHTEYLLGSVTITDGSFSLYAQDADLLSGSYAVFGWAWIRLVSR